MVYIRRQAAARRMPGRAFFEAAARRMGEFTEEVRCRCLLSPPYACLFDAAARRMGEHPEEALC